MSAVINHNLFLIKEHIGLFKAANNYDVYDPATGDLIMECREPNLGWFTKLLRFTDYKRFTPFDVQLRTPQDERIVRVQRGISIFMSEVEVRDGDNELLGRFIQKLFSIGGKFDLVDANNQPLCSLEGNWVGWEFNFKQGDTVLAHVTKKWGGIGAEMFTSADNYILEINPIVEQDSDLRRLIIAAVMCIDMVLKE